MISVCERLAAPVVKALLGKAVIADDHPYSLGGLGLLGTGPASDAMNEADILLMIGTSFRTLIIFRNQDKQEAFKLISYLKKLELGIQWKLG